MSESGSDPAASLLDVAHAGKALGERSQGRESGDLHVVAPFSDGVLVAVIDGLGHGTAAAEAATAAARVLTDHAPEPVQSLVQRCHEELRKTRGAVMSLASFHGRDSQVSWLGVGNVEGFLYRADPFAERRREAIGVRAGVVGYRLPPLRAAVVPVSRGDTLIMVTDGIRGRFTADVPLERSPQEIVDSILARHNKGTDDALVLVARYQGLTS